MAEKAKWAPLQFQTTQRCRVLWEPPPPRRNEVEVTFRCNNWTKFKQKHMLPRGATMADVIVRHGLFSSSNCLLQVRRVLGTVQGIPEEVTAMCEWMKGSLGPEHALKNIKIKINWHYQTGAHLQRRFASLGNSMAEFVSVLHQNVGTAFYIDDDEWSIYGHETYAHPYNAPHRNPVARFNGGRILCIHRTEQEVIQELLSLPLLGGKPTVLKMPMNVFNLPELPDSPTSLSERAYSYGAGKREKLPCGIGLFITSSYPYWPRSCVADYELHLHVETGLMQSMYSVSYHCSIAC